MVSEEQLNSVILEFTFSKDREVKHLKNVIKLDSKKNKSGAIGSLIAALIILTISIICTLDDGKINPFLFLSIPFFLISLIYFFLYANYVKRKYLSILKKTEEYYSPPKNHYSYEINMTGFKFQDHSRTLEYKWEIFKNYREIDGSIYLMVDEHFIRSTTFNKDWVSAEKFDEIRSIVSKNVKLH